MIGRHAILALACALIPVAGSAQDGAAEDAGAYLAGRAAGGAYDFDTAAALFQRALAADPDNGDLIEASIASLLGMGRFDDATPLAERSAEGRSQLSSLTLMATAARDEDWTRLTLQLDDGMDVADLVDVLARAWALIGQGDTGGAVAVFDDLAEQPGSLGFALYHKAMALAASGDWQAADAVLSMPPEAGLPRTRRSLVAHLQVLSQLGRNDDAVTLLDEAFGASLDPAIGDLRARLTADETLPFTVVRDAREGVAEVYYSVAGTLMGQEMNALVLLFARTAQMLHPDDAEITLMVGGILEDFERYDLAAETFATVSPDDAAWHAAEFGRADALRQAGRTDLAVEVLQSLVRRSPDLAMAHVELGDMLRRLDRVDEANVAYTDALALIPETEPRYGMVRYLRGRTWHDMGDWTAAEADLRASLDLNPGNPGVLNYLGYSLVERGENLEEALGMIERAVEAQPDSGAIVDSLGWALYRIGRVDEAVAPMERAAELLPEDPVINDHLGDVYWSVGRRLEARFQWRRALSFDPDADLAEAIRAKIEGGVTTVMDDGAPADPVDVAQDL